MRTPWAMLAAAAAVLFSLNSAAADAPERFMSLRSAGAEGRQGPGLDHRVLWIYQHARLPLQVVAEQSGWLHVRDPDGADVWMRADALEPRRTIYVRAETMLRKAPREGGQPIARLAPGVIASITACEGEWRRVAVGGRIGWVENNAIWGGGCAGLAPAIRP
ncbi:MAG: SH3 domain-containing protein [Hyphomonadaceae bacterium]